MIKRLKTDQDMIGEWICEKIYRAEAIMQGFYKKDLAGNNVLDYPEIRWNDLNLRDESQSKQMELQLLEKKIVSTKHLCEKFEIDYDVETERVRLETQYQQQMGIAPGGGQEGGLGGGFGGGGGGASGGGGGLGDLLGGGGAPTTPGDTGAPGLPNDSIAPSMSGGEVPKGGSGSGGPSMAAYDTQLKNKEQALKVLPVVIRPNKRPLFNPKAPKIEKQKPVEMSNKYIYDGPRTGMVRLTEPEMILYGLIEKGVKASNLPADFVWQKKPEPIHMSRVVVDGFFPSLKLIVEADGKRWHNTPEDIAKDQNRDYRLSRFGWKILRFTEDQLKHESQDVLAKIIETANAMKDTKEASWVIYRTSEKIYFEQREVTAEQFEAAQKEFEENQNEEDLVCIAEYGIKRLIKNAEFIESEEIIDADENDQRIE
jgi:hypothetical protein